MNEQLHLSRPQTPNEPNVATRAHDPASAELPGDKDEGQSLFVSLSNSRPMSYLCQSHANEKKQSCSPLGITGRRLVPLHTWQTADMPTHKALEEAEKEEEEEGGEGRVGAGPNGRGAHRRTTGLRTAGRGGKYN